jgi:hypothetical protein
MYPDTSRKIKSKFDYFAAEKSLLIFEPEKASMWNVDYIHADRLFFVAAEF